VIQLNIHDAKTHLSKYLKLIEKGEVIVLCRHNKPLAEIRRIQAKPLKPRTIGWAKGTFKVPKSFFDPLPEDLLKSFNGETE
jgi:antitoxin (DNA-binding transcriptional repressor) of toxin-antitoxin stability system